MILQRVAYNKERTFGVLKENKVPFCLTLELPWKDNKPYISCIPSGEYICKRFTRPSGVFTWEITKVPGRTLILFHIANLVRDLQGCVGTGEEFGILKNEPAILSSGRAFAEFMRLTKDYEEFPLTIIGEPCTT